MAEPTTDPFTTKPPIGPPTPWDPRCPGCLSGVGPPRDPKEDVAELEPAQG
jgi:hypothetical protein